ncbi:DUF1330 domain-containing protein [Rosenbergiella epipactidis]|uniref:DUF1330 domain-containing protein n=1 Tax=Rosenbergiella epipactidis TaxID=1544694 RepID=UPI001F4EE714|nr:DUF1330 domain-containing protein [Rosenbergiella epipactidis]
MKLHIILRIIYLPMILFIANFHDVYASPIPVEAPAYYVAEFQLTNPKTIKPYSQNVEKTFKPYSGRFIVRGSDIEVKEGFGAQGRLIIIKFDSLKKARDWYNSREYQKLIPIRQRSGNTRTYIVQGLPGKLSFE